MFICTLLQWIFPIAHDNGTIQIRERYDPALKQIRTLSRLKSLVEKKSTTRGFVNNGAIVDSAGYAFILDSILQYRFYSGFGDYSWRHNYLAGLAGLLVMRDLATSVLPKDIIRFDGAICSQQAILFQHVLRQKGYKTRRIGFRSEDLGHYASEVYYDKEFHFFDSNLEAVYEDYRHVPSINQLCADTAYLKKVYESSPIVDKLSHMYTHHQLLPGPTNQPLAPEAALFHNITGFMSHTLFIFTGIFGFLLSYRKRSQL